MHDTPIEVYREQVRIWLSKPFAERMRLGWEADAASLADAARLVGRQSDDPAALFLALHGHAFDERSRNRLAEAIRAHFAAGLAR